MDIYGHVGRTNRNFMSLTITQLFGWKDIVDVLKQSFFKKLMWRGSMENKKHKVTKEWYEKIANSYLVRTFNPKIGFEEHLKLKQWYLDQRDKQ
jgi:hypothetical protein